MQYCTVYCTILYATQCGAEVVFGSPLELLYSIYCTVRTVQYSSAASHPGEHSAMDTRLAEDGQMQVARPQVEKQEAPLRMTKQEAPVRMKKQEAPCKMDTALMSAVCKKPVSRWRSKTPHSQSFSMAPCLCGTSPASKRHGARPARHLEPRAAVADRQKSTPVCIIDIDSTNLTLQRELLARKFFRRGKLSKGLN